MLLFMKKTLKAKAFVMNDIINLFRIDWIELFNSWDLPKNLFYKNVNVFSTSTNKLLDELDLCTKTKVTFQTKENAILVFKTE